MAFMEASCILCICLGKRLQPCWAIFMGWRKCAARKRREGGARWCKGRKRGEGGARADEKGGVHFSPLSFVKSGIRMQRKEKEDEDGEMKRMSWEWDRLKLGDRVRD